MFDKHPTWIAMAQDGVGHCYGFTGVPCWHPNSKRWILPFGGEAHSMGLQRLLNPPETSCIVRPGKEAEVSAKQQEWYDQCRGKMPAQPQGPELNQGDVFGSSNNGPSHSSSRGSLF